MEPCINTVTLNALGLYIIAIGLKCHRPGVAICHVSNKIYGPHKLPHNISAYGTISAPDVTRTNQRLL
jgi:hypothetical protein